MQSYIKSALETLLIGYQNVTELHPRPKWQLTTDVVSGFIFNIRAGCLFNNNSKSRYMLGAKQRCGVTAFQQMVHYSARWRLLWYMLVLMPPSADYCQHRKRLLLKLVASTVFRLPEHTVHTVFTAATCLAGTMKNTSNDVTKTDAGRIEKIKEEELG